MCHQDDACVGWTLLMDSDANFDVVLAISQTKETIRVEAFDFFRNGLRSLCLYNIFPGDEANIIIGRVLGYVSLLRPAEWRNA